LADERAAIQDARGVDENIQKQGEQREVQSNAAIVAALQKFRHGVGLTANDGRQQEQTEEHQNDNGRPFVVVYGNADGVGAAGKPDQRRR
jgi:hypothetical protein